MAGPDSSSPSRSGCITDARGRRVTQVDPVAIYILRQHDLVDAATLRAIANERGVRVTAGERAALIGGLCGALLVISFFTLEFITGGIGDAPMAKSAGLLYLCSLPWIFWYSIKRKRFKNVAGAMLRHLRCPHCCYDLRMLPVDPEDGATVCPECGCAWRLAPEAR